ncbi:MAG: helix-turn-helix domain-containing protein [Candidatus Aminicenantales bacterium]
MADYLHHLFDTHTDPLPVNSQPLPTLENLIQKYIHYVLELTYYNISETAKILNISRTTLYNKIHKYNIKIHSESSSV